MKEYPTKQEFLERLRRPLLNRLPQARLEKELAYYEDYIDIRLRTGDSGEELFERLGDPELLARTILAVWEDEKNAAKKKGLFSGLLDRLKKLWEGLA